MNLTDTNLGHRERLREKFVQHKCVDYEVLELLLTYAIPRVDVKPIGRRLLQQYRNPHAVLSANLEDLIAVPGVGKNTAIFIKAIYEIMLLDYKSYLQDSPIFHDYKRLVDYCKLLLEGKLAEEFHVLYLDSAYRLLTTDLHSSGTIDYAAVYPREILKRALDINARTVVLLHNHPTPNTSFSNEDIAMTLNIKSILDTVGIELYDHLLVSGDLVYSAKNLFLIS